MANDKRESGGTKGGGGAGGARGGEAGGGGLPVPRWLPVVLLGVTTLLLFREFVFSDRMLLGNDTLSLGYMAREFYAEALRDGVFPRWNPLVLGGIPFVDALAGGDSLYPTALLLLLAEPYRALGWKLVLHVFLAGLFMFGWVRALGRSRTAALLSGLAFGVAPFMVSLVHPGHDGKLFVTALTPLLFWAMERTFTRPGLRPHVLVSVVVALVILTTHFQLAYFLFGAAGLYYIFRSWSAWRGEGRDVAPAASRFTLFLGFSVLGAAVAAVQIVPAVEYVTESSRRTATTTRADPGQNRAYASSWGLHPEEAVSFVVPEFAGNNARGAGWDQNSYWGRNGFKDNHEYTGFVVLLLALAGFFGAPRNLLRWFFAGLGLLALLYALGEHTPVWGMAYALLPGVRLFRAPSMVSFLFGFSAITLMAFGVDRILALAGGPRGGRGEGGGSGRGGGGGGSGGAAGGEDRTSGGDGSGGRLVVTLWAVAAVVAVGMLMAAGGALSALWTSVVYPDMGAVRMSLLEQHRPFIVRGFFVAALLAGLVAGVAAAARRGFLKPLAVAAVLGVLVFVDGFRISAPFVQTLDFYAWSTPDPIVRELLDRQTRQPPFRVASYQRNAQEVAPAMHGLELATGHHPNDLARYRELIGMEGSSAPAWLMEPNVREVLNIRYLVWPEELGPLTGAPQPILQTRLQSQPYESLYELPTLPRARLVAAARVVPDAEAVEVIRSEGFDPATEAVLAAEPPLELDGGPVEGEVTWEERGLNRQRLRVTTDRNALLVIADNWYPAWRATVDGTEAPVLRAYHTLRAVPVGPGDHVVELRYESPLLKGSLAVSLGALLLLGGVAGASTLRRRRGRTDAGG